MTVGTLIKYLQKYDENEIVRLHNIDGEPVLFALQAVNKPGVWLETESDADMAEEINARFEDAVINGVDEGEVYSLMLEHGIDINMVEKYAGCDVANKMRSYCKCHGLL